ncbi:MAG: primosomal protein N' [Candidatus Competibacterales bacterium]
MDALLSPPAADSPPTTPTLTPAVWQVAVSLPIAATYDYLPPPEAREPPVAGLRVTVPLGKRVTTGVVVGSAARSEVPPHRLRRVMGVLDTTPALDDELMALVSWAARYYHHPLGDALATAQPGRLRQGGEANEALERPDPDQPWVITPAGRAALAGPLLARKPRQRGILGLLADHPRGLNRFELRSQGAVGEPLRQVVAQGWIAPAPRRRAPSAMAPVPALNDDQRRAVGAIDGAAGRFQAFLLFGITGSGKTEVYLEAMAKTLTRGQQVLVLVPEIGLTPQLLQRLGRLGQPVVALHSGLTDRERLDNWRQAKAGQAKVVVGTRSAVFTPLPHLGLIVLDEEHDPSFKQQEGFRYHARDVALVRAKNRGIPVVLGSATPALETLKNALEGRYQQLTLSRRPGAAVLPRVSLVDVRDKRLDGGLAPATLAQIQATLQRPDEQVLIFLNRRGYAPSVMCHACGWVVMCHHCDAAMTYHQRAGRLICHHCGSNRPHPGRCHHCEGGDLAPVGRGTEQLEEVLEARFGQFGVVRIDRDTTRRRGALEGLLADARTGRARVLVGTQLLAKGHDFPDLTLVVIVNADAGLFAADFRREERFLQTLFQVAGRAGRGAKSGQVLVQSHHVDHPLMAALAHKDYGALAAHLLTSRASCSLPPFGACAVLRAEAPERPVVEDFLARAVASAKPLPSGVELLGPAPAALERRAGRYRHQLLVKGKSRRDLQGFLRQWVPVVRALEGGQKVRWAVDVDPLEPL